MAWNDEGMGEAGHGVDPAAAEADLLRATERQRLRALVLADMERADQLHAEDFQLITPSGSALSKEQYLGRIASGEFDYLVWDPASIEVRLHGDVAVLRYRSELKITVRGQESPLGHYWHTDSYEKHDGRWQVVWSQATEIR